ncbi:M23 family metallopeptidase [Paenibacillus sp. SC116]|uniref:M23 family metallopeptidase n=1 Tax=Paenibacillus sp. SC116 TaxID=2968986 RepID=UPI00215A5D72|nr:M23 family metallopeptidase [Paenibacillus sp. SC116]MCR8843929.1 M23 family metallopeptidase [Paenibacillus sp. SC116]
MQTIPNELMQTIGKRLKLGENAKPVCRVEVDRLAFIPGRTEELEFLVPYEAEIKKVYHRWVTDPDNSQAEVINEPEKFTIPLQGFTWDNVSSPYRSKHRPNHAGIDIAAPKGTEVYAAWNGTVVRSRNSQSAGLHINILHTDGYMTRYMHLSKLHVKEGEKVQQGQLIGLVGSTGQSTGNHLHFEIRRNASTSDWGKDEDPTPYFRQQISKSSTSIWSGGNQQVQQIGEGTPGEVVFVEKFLNPQWMNKKHYALDASFKQIASRTGVTTYKPTTKQGFHNLVFLRKNNIKKASMTLQLNLSDPSYLDVEFGTDFNHVNGDMFEIYANSKLIYRQRRFTDGHKMEKFDCGLPIGKVNLQFVMTASGQEDVSFCFYMIKVTKLNPPNFKSNRDKSNLDPLLKSTHEQHEIKDMLLGVKREPVELQVGSFVYMDTIPLQNILDVNIEDDYELSASVATVTISNPEGFYSPDYNPALFPETGRESPYSYELNGARVGVLSENTPIRIYMGYGQHQVRVFTGLIDKVDMSNDSTLTITCRNMFKRALEKVLTSTKMYPEDMSRYEPLLFEGAEPAPPLPPPTVPPTDPTKPPTDPPTDPTKPPKPVESFNYRQQIIDEAHVQANKQGVDPYFLLAICRHETQMGTQGKGTPEKGGFVLGYGCRDGLPCDERYRGLRSQMYYGAVRMKEALRDRAIRLNSKNDVDFFHQGGHKNIPGGRQFIWSSDRHNWVSRVWDYYQDILRNPGPWMPLKGGLPRTVRRALTSQQSAASTTPPPANSTQETPSSNATAWVKSAVVQDLIGEAGMYGWRVTAEDRQHPDAVIEETYLIELNQAKGYVIQAIPDQVGEFKKVPIDSIATPLGWLNPFTEQSGKTFEAFRYKVAEAIEEVLAPTNFRYYCDRNGTFRIERINLNKPVVATLSEHDNLMTISKTIDMSRARSHIVVVDSEQKKENFMDKELLLELKGELRTAVVHVPWAKSYEQKRQVAEKMFFDMKRTSRTLQVVIPMDPSMDVLDRVYVINQQTTTRGEYIIKSIHTRFTAQGAVQVMDLMWAVEGTVF